MRKFLTMLLLTFVGILVINSYQTRQAQERKAEVQERSEQSLPQSDIELTTTPVSYDDRAGDYVATTSYKVGEDVRIALTMINRMGQRTVVGWADSLFQNRLKLQKNGHEIEYLPGLPDKISKKEKYGHDGSVRSIELQPNESKRIGLIYLKSWYPPLEAGQYQLKIKHKLFGEVKPVHSNEVTFEVVP